MRQTDNGRFPYDEDETRGAYGDEQAYGAVSAASEEIETDSEAIKCPACGANMVYDSQRGKLYCEHCGTEQAVEADHSEERAFEELLRGDGAWGAESRVLRCENCGARVVLDRREIATSCPFCGTTNIVEAEELPGLRPNAVVPFAIGKEAAAGNVKSWAKRKFFAPQKFRKGAKPENMNGVYIPAFTFDASTTSDYIGVLGKYYYRTRYRNGKPVRERYIKYFHVSGRFTSAFDDVLIQASDSIDQKSLNALQPFHTNDSKEYSREYLSGFTANQSAKDGLACWEEAKSVMRSRLRTQILSRYDYDVVRSFDFSMECRNITYKYILIPVYVGHCTWRKKLYQFFVNGLSGKVTGERPTSPVKVTVLIVLLIGVAVGLYFLWKYFAG